MRTRRLSIIAAAIAFALMVTATASNAADILVSQNLGSSAYSASVSYNSNYAPAKAFDGLPDGDSSQWNAGGAAPQWIEANLGRTYSISKMVLSNFGAVADAHQIRYSLSTIGAGGASTLQTTLTGSATGYTYTFPSPVSARCVQVKTTVGSGWINWYEVKIYAASSTLAGTVRSTAPGTPAVAGATVATSDGKYSTATAANGTYSLSVPAGTDSFLVSKPGFTGAYVANVALAANTTVTRDFSLEPGRLMSQGLPASSYTASTSYPGYGPGLAFDGSFANASRWVASSNTSWIEVDLGSSYSISKILLSACMLPSGNTVDEVRVSSSPIGSETGTTNLVHTFSGLTEDISFKVKDFAPSVTGRYVQVRTTSSPSWNSWYEIQVFSPLCTVSGTVSSTVNGLATIAGVTVATRDGQYSAVTSANGVYSLVLPAGTINLLATKSGYLAGSGQVVTQPSDTATVNFDLKNVVNVASINGLGNVANGTGVKLTQLMAATAGSNTFADGGYYIEEINRTAGIRIVPQPGVGAVSIGDRANFSGVMSTDTATGERFISVVLVENQAAAEPIRPLGAVNKAIAGAGTSPAGLLMTVWGKVTHKDSSGAFMYVDDGSKAGGGSEPVGIKVLLDGTELSASAVVDDYVSVTGIVQPQSPSVLRIKAIGVKNYSSMEVEGESLVLAAQIPNNLRFNDIVPGTVVVRSTYLPGQAGTVTYEQGIDYVVNYAQGTIARTATSRIPDYSTNILYGVTNFDHSQYPGYGNNAFLVFVDSQTHSGQPFTVATDQSALLTQTAARLRAGGPFKIIAFGDSIAAGGEASSEALRFPNRYAASLQQRFPQAQITMENGSTGGDTSSDGLARLQAKVLSRSPNLVLVAFGMNDHNGYGYGVPVATFEQNLTTMVNSIKANTGAEVILVSAFPPNPEWMISSHSMGSYAAATQRVAANRQCAYADLYSAWMGVLQRKDSPSMLGNNINHPTDFGHWLYLEALKAVTF